MVIRSAAQALAFTVIQPSASTNLETKLIDAIVDVLELVQPSVSSVGNR